MNFSKTIKIAGLSVEITSTTNDFGVEGSPEWDETDVMFGKTLSKKEYIRFLDHIGVGYDDDMEHENMENETWDEVVEWAEKLIASCVEYESEENWRDGYDEGFDIEEENRWHPMGVNL